MATCKDVDTGSDQITQLCNFCDSNVSDGFCGDCEDHMCLSCFDIHTRAKACRHHVLLDSTCQKGDKNTYSESCKLHPSMIIKFYCVAHKIVGCVECFFPEHRNCNYQNIETAAKLFQDSGEDTRIKREIQRLGNTHSEYTRRYEDDKETVAVINNTVVKDVKSFTDSVTSYVAQVEKNMLEKSESLHIENETRLERRSNDLHSVGNEIEKCKMQLENEERVDRLFISAIEIGPVIEQLGKNITSIGRQHAITKYEFQPNKLIMEMTNGSGSLGEICILPEEPKPKQHDVSNDSDVEVIEDVLEEEASSNLESIPPPLKDMVESTRLSHQENLNDHKKYTNNGSENENVTAATEMPLKSPVAEKRGTFKLKSAKVGNFYFIKSDVCSKPLKYTPQSEKVFIDEENDMLFDGDRCCTIIAKDGVITLDEIVDAAKTNRTHVKATSSQNQSQSTNPNDSGGSCVGAGGASAMVNELADAWDKLRYQGQNKPGSAPEIKSKGDKKTADMSEDKSLELCVICMDTVTDPKTIQCGHAFCTDCIDQQFTYQKKCPTCGKHCGVIRGDQPDGNMTEIVYQYKNLPGFENYGTIYITYNFPPGKQQSCHPSPGYPYKGIARTAYLPDNEEGRKILKMLRIAFDRKLTFTIGNSRTTGQEGVITWNDIHHKTDHRSYTQFGYPDPTYLERVKDELAAKGVTEEDI